jgi:hypothetical protein
MRARTREMLDNLMLDAFMMLAVHFFDAEREERREKLKEGARGIRKSPN